MENKKAIIIFAIVLVIVSGLSIYFFISSQVPMNDEFTVGNTAGNLYNNGLFLEMNGKVYFSNPLGHDCLYSMNPDETDLKELTVMAVKNIAGAGKYLYFYLDKSNTSLSSGIGGLGKVSTYYGLYRCDLDGDNQILLDQCKLSALQLVGSRVYYTLPLGEDAGVHSIRIDGKDEQHITSEPFNPSCVQDGKIYYSGIDLDHNLHSFNTLSNGATSTILDGNIWQPIISGGYVYYIDAARDYCICRTSLGTKITQVLTDARVDFYNMNESYIFYATSVSNHPALYVMRHDGLGKAVVAEGIYHSLSLTSKYLYFKPYDVENVLFHVPVDGSAPVSTFLPYTE